VAISATTFTDCGIILLNSPSWENWEYL